MGQAVTVKILSTIIIKKMYEAAYMLSGPSGGGKTTLARIFAQAILCESPISGNPCGICPSCISFKEEKHVGYKELDAATFSSKEDIIELRDDAFFHPMSGRKVILLDESHDISKQGQDALLKQVEECPEYLTYIFCTTDPNKMKETLRKRCMEFQITAVDSNIVADRLEEICIKENIIYEKEALNIIAEKSGGNVRDAINVLEKASCFGEVSTEKIKDVSRNYDEEVCEFLISLGSDLNRSLSICKKLSSSISEREIYNNVIAMLTDVSKLIFGYDQFTSTRKILLEKLKSQYGLLVTEFLGYLIQRDKYIDKTGFQSDIVLLHYKFCSNSFNPSNANQKNVQNFIVQKEESQKESKNEIKTISPTGLLRMDVKERSRALRQQRKGFVKEESQKDRVPSEWPLPKQERVGEDSLDNEMLSPQEFSLGLVGGRVGRKT